MLTPSPTSTYPSYTPLPRVPSKTDGSGIEPRLREIRVVTTDADPRRESTYTADGENSLPRRDASPPIAGSSQRGSGFSRHAGQRYNAPIYSPDAAPTWLSPQQDIARAPSLWQVLGHSPVSAPLAAHTPQTFKAANHTTATRFAPSATATAAAAAAPPPPPLVARSSNGASHSPLLYHAGRRSAPTSSFSSPYRHVTSSAVVDQAARMPASTAASSDVGHDVTDQRLRLVAAECEELMSVLREGSTASAPAHRPRLESFAPPSTEAQPSATAYATGLADSTTFSSREEEDAEDGYLHEPRAVLTGDAGDLVGDPSRRSSDALGLEDGSRSTYNALMGALQELAQEQQKQHQQSQADYHRQSMWHDGEDDDDGSAICVAPPDLAPELDTPADFIAPFSLKWMVFLLQRRERRLRKTLENGPTTVSEDVPLAVKMVATLRESLTYLQSTLSTTLTRTKAQQLSQLLLYVSNVVSRLAHEDDLHHEQKTQSRDTQEALCDELERTADALDAALSAKESLALELAAAQNELQVSQEQLQTVQAEKTALTQHYDRVAADNAEILSRLQEAEEAAKVASQRGKSGDGADDGEGSESTTSTERRCAIDSMQEEYDRLQALMNRQTNSMRDLRGDLDDAESENDQLRAVIAQLRQSVLRHRTVVDLLTRRKKEGGVGLPDPSSELIDDILSGAKPIDDSDLDTESTLD